MGETMVLLTGDTPYHGQGLCSSVHALLSMHYGKVSCLFTVDGDRHLVREL